MIIDVKTKPPIRAVFCSTSPLGGDLSHRYLDRAGRCCLAIGELEMTSNGVRFKIPVATLPTMLTQR